ncbi:MAG: PRC and DUF2382 domain-containing protein [Solirubrobacterales bacterium]|nr:PRC and DUF2382 domain-containing protein [Solirubrobacterales bacterium]
MPQMTEAYQWHGRKVVDKTGEPVGKIEEIYEDQLSGEPEWALVHTGLFGSRSHLVPLIGASPDGGDVRVEVLKEQVHGAPSLDVTDELSELQERRLFTHYGMRFGPRPEAATAGEVRAPIEGTASGRAIDDVPVVSPAPLRHGMQAEAAAADIPDQPGQPRFEPAAKGRADEPITRSEEELQIGLERRERGRVRLRKYVVTEQVTKTVPVRREVLRVEREPITESSRPGTLPDSGISEEEHEVLLYEEEPIVEKRVVPKERVRLGKETITDETEVCEEIRKERIDTDARDR